MLWIMLLAVIYARAENFAVEDAPTNRFLYNELSVTFDHCKDPQRLNRETWSCECPSGLQKIGDECICHDCLVNANNETYVEKVGQSLPEYLASFLRELDEEEEEERRISESSKDGGEVATRMLLEYKRSRKKGKRKRPKSKLKLLTEKQLQSYQKKILGILRLVSLKCEEPYLTARRAMVSPRIIVAKKDSSLMSFLDRLRSKPLRKQKKKIRIKKIDWGKSRILNLRKPIKFMRPEKKREREEGQTFSDSTVGDQTRGSVESGRDKAYGAMTNFYGTGSMSLGAGQGSAAASAYTGEGISVSGVESLGAKAFGFGLVGKKAFRGTSTTTLLIGEGDAIATNSQTKKASASATAVATNMTASAGSTAYGDATAAASAVPGKGDANGSAVYDDGLRVSAAVSGEAGAVAETVSVGDGRDDLEALVVSKKEEGVGDGLKYNFLGRSKEGRSSGSDFFGDGDSISDWFT